MYNYFMFFKPVRRKFSCGMWNRLVFSLSIYTNFKYEETFHYWVLTKFDSSDKYLKWDFRKRMPLLKSLDSYKLKNMSSEEIACFIWTLKQEGILSQQHIKKIDTELEKRIHTGEMNYKDVLPLIGSLALLLVSQVMRCKTYKKSMIFLLSNPPSAVHHKIQAMYYASLGKKEDVSKTLIQSLMKRISLEELNSLSSEELGILCNSSFRSSVQITNKCILSYIKEILHKDLPVLIKNPYILICLIKCLRHSKYYDDELFKKISSLSLDILSEVPLIARIHLTVYLCDALYKNIFFISKLISISVCELNTSINEGKPPRLKDIDNILWCASQYSLQEVTNEINDSQILDYILNLSKEDVKNEVIIILNSLLSFWIMDCSNKKDIISFLHREQISVASVARTFKDNSRISLLLSCCNIEGKHLLGYRSPFELIKTQTPSIGQHIVARPKFAQVLLYLTQNKQPFCIQDVNFSYPIPCLNIASISAVHTSGLIYFEVIDEFVCLRNSSILHGHMKLKFRLQEKLGMRTFKVNLCKLQPTDQVLTKEFEKFAL